MTVRVRRSVRGVAAMARIALLALGSAQLVAAAPLPESLTPAAAVSSDRPFAQVTAPVPLSFPRDHGPHPDFRQEWWYFTGNLDGPRGERFGFELTLFRVALVPPPDSVGESRGVGVGMEHGWRAQQYYFAHFAVTDGRGKRFYAAERAARDALGLAGAQGDPLHVWLRDWSVQQTNTPSGVSWRLNAADGDDAIDLSLEPGVPVLNGDRGFSRKSDEPGSASIYYSIPRLKVSGVLTHDTKAVEVSGLAWLDREWGSGALGAQQSGWDWFALQLDDGSALMYYRLRDRNGLTDPHSAGTLIDVAGTATALAASELAITPLASWDSPRGGRYPARWRLRLPQRALEVEVVPILADQELNVSPRYWEGAVDVRGTREGRPISGRGYVELVGYARPRG